MTLAYKGDTTCVFIRFVFTVVEWIGSRMKQVVSEASVTKPVSLAHQPASNCYCISRLGMVV